MADNSVDMTQSKYWEKAKRSAAAVELVGRLLFPEGADLRGLIVVAGATLSRKTTFILGLIDRYLSDLRSRWVPKDRNRARPHLLTYEDPIEVPFGSVPEKIQQEFGIDYTARQKDLDASSLDEVVRDALRQTPSMLFVGEVRERDDWKALLRFAATGHLAMTTTHAGSLTETMGNILQSVDALQLPAARGQFASRLHALVHLKSVCGTVLPALWLSSTSTIASLVTDGQSSIIPHRNDPAMTLGCCGRLCFVEHLAGTADGESYLLDGRPKSTLSDIKRAAAKADLEGT